MKPVRLCVAFSLLFFIFQAFGSTVRGENPLLLSGTVGKEIVVLDSIVVELGEDKDVCIDDSVWLESKNDGRTVFAYEWIDKETGKLLSKERGIWVSPRKSTKYILNVYYFSGECITNGDFEDVSLPENQRVKTEYRWVKTIPSQGWWNPGNAGEELWDEGTYRIGKNPANFHPSFYSITDHTGRGNMMILNGDKNRNALVWEQKVKVKRGDIYAFSTWGVSVSSGNPAVFHFTINGKVLGADFQLTDVKTVRDAKWEQFYELWTADSDEAVISLVNLKMAQAGNDFAVDDISFASMKKETGEITVNVLPHIVVNSLPDQTLCEGENHTIGVVAYGSGLTYEWAKSGGMILSRDSVLVLENVTAGTAGNYFCRVSGLCPNRDVKDFKITVNRRLRINDYADTVSVCDGTKAELFVDADGVDVNYAWSGPGSRNWVGVNSPVYTKVTVQKATDAGLYQCVMGSACGADTIYTQLHVVDKLELTGVSPDTTVCLDSRYELWVDVNIDTDSCIWHLGEKRLTDANHLLIDPVRLENAGIYRYRIMSRCGHLEGDVRLGTFPVMGALSLNGDTLVCRNSRAQFTASVVNGAGLKYKWTGPKSLPESPIVVFDRVTDADTGLYRLTVTDTCGNIRTDSIHLKMAKDLVVSPYDAKLESCAGTSIVLTAEVEGQGLNFLWSKKGGSPDHSGRTLELNNIMAADSGMYECNVTSMCGNITLDYHLRVMEVTDISYRTPDRYICTNDSLELKVIASGEDIVYNWKKNDFPVGDGSNVHNLHQVSLADSAHFVCLVSGTCGTDSAEINVSVGEFVLLTGDASVSLCEGSSYSYLVKTDHCADLDYTYRWVFNGGTDTICHTELLKLSDLKKADAGVYSCIVHSRCGNAVVQLTINVVELPKVTAITPDIFITEGKEHEIKVVATGDSLAYSWTKNGQEFKDPIKVNNNIISFKPVVLEDAGAYKLTLANRCAKVYATSSLGVWRKTVVLCPQSRTDSVCVGSDRNFKVEAQGELGLTYTWYHETDRIAQTATGDFAITGAKESDKGRYMCVVNGRGGDDTCYIDLKVNKLPAFNLGGRFDVCDYEAGSVYNIVTTDAGLKYNWTVAGGDLTESGDRATEIIDWKGVGNASIRVNAVSALTGCASIVVQPVTINALPVVSLNIPEQVGYCVDSLQLDTMATPRGVGGRFWVDNVESEYIRFTDKSKIYNVVFTYTDAHLCRATALDEVQVAGVPLVKTPDILTTGQCKPLNIENVETTRGWISWTPATGLSDPTIQNPVFTPGATTTYRVKLTDKYGCTAFDDIKIEVLPAPTAVLPADQEIGMCSNLVIPLVYTAGTPVAVVWSPDSNLRINADFSAELIKKPLGAQSYKATVTDAFGCMAGDEIKVTVHEQPQLGEDISICYGDSVSVNCSAYHSFVWSDGNPNAIRTLKDVGMYRLEVTDLYGCKDEVFYLINPLPLLKLGIEDTVGYCRNSLVLDMARPVGGTYWVNGVEADSVIFDNKQANYRIDYKYTDENRCSLTVSDTIYVAEAPYIQLQDTAVTGICRPIVMPVQRAVQGVVRWMPADHLDDAGILRPLFTPGRSGKYDVSVTDKYGCEVRDSIEVKVIDAPVIEVVKDTIVGMCDNFALSVNVISEALDTVLWNPAGQIVVNEDYSIAFVNQQPGDYRFQIVAKDRFGCVAADSVKIKMMALPTVLLPEDMEAGECNQLTFPLHYTSATPVTVAWSPDSNLRMNADFSATMLKMTNGEHSFVARVTDAFGCSADDTLNVTIHQQPHLGDDSSICFGDTVVVDCRGYQNFTWSDGSTDSIRVLKAVGAYRLRVLDNYGCSDEILYTVNPRPAVEMNLRDTVGSCQKQLILDMARPAGGVYFVNGIKADTVVFTANKPDYVVEYRYADQNYCMATVSDTLHVALLPFIEIQDSIATGACRSFTMPVTDASPGYVRWEPSDYLSNAGILRPVFYPGESRKYRVTLTDKYGCEVNDTVAVHVVKAPAIHMAHDTVVGMCRDFVLPVQVVSEALDTVLWTPDANLRIFEDYSIALLNQQPGDYRFKIVAKDKFGCEISDAVNISVFASPDLGGDREICQGDTVTVDCRSYEKYGWNDGFSESVRIIQAPGNYTVWVSDRYGCGDTADYLVKKLPAVDFELPDWVGYCLDSLRIDVADPVGGTYWVDGVSTQTIVFKDKDRSYQAEYRYADSVSGCTAIVKEPVRVDIRPMIGLPDNVEAGECASIQLPVDTVTVGDVKWMPADYLSSDDELRPTFTPGKTTVYRASLIDEYGCVAVDSMRVVVVPLPTIRAMDDTLIGSCNDLTLKVDFTTEALKTVVWQPSRDVSVNSDYTAELKTKRPGENQYVAWVYDRFGCKAGDTVVVNIMAAPDLGGDKAICEPDSLLVNCSGYSEYKWHDGYTGESRVLSDVGDYTLDVVDQYGCNDVAAYSIHPIPNVQLVDTFIFEGENMEFLIEPDPQYGPYDITWQDGSGRTFMRVDKEGYYSIVVKDNIGCTVTDTAFLEVKKRAIAAPTAFLPNSSGVNSKFYLKEVNFVGRFEMYIYDRWGELVYKTDKIGFDGGWNGNFNGMNCAAGAYVWVAYADGKPVGRGTLVLVK